MIVVSLDRLLAQRRLSLVELADRTGIAERDLRLLRGQKALAMRFSTLDALCKAFECQPQDLLNYVADEDA